MPSVRPGTSEFSSVNVKLESAPQLHPGCHNFPIIKKGNLTLLCLLREDRIFKGLKWFVFNNSCSMHTQSNSEGIRRGVECCRCKICVTNS